MNSKEVSDELKALQKKYFLAIDEAYQARSTLGEEIFETMRRDLFDRYIIERNQLNKAAKIPDKNLDFETDLKIDELTPHRCGFLWLLKNEARKLKEREVAVDDRVELDARTSDVEAREEKVYGESNTNVKPQKRSWLKRLFKRGKTKSAGDVQREDPPVQTQNEPAAVAQSSEPSTAAPGANDTKQQSTNNGITVDPPALAPTSEALKRGHKRKTPAESTSEPLPVTGQLAGQIGIEEITGK